MTNKDIVNKVLHNADLIPGNMNIPDGGSNGPQYFEEVNRYGLHDIFGSMPGQSFYAND